MIILPRPLSFAITCLAILSIAAIIFIISVVVSDIDREFPRLFIWITGLSFLGVAMLAFIVAIIYCVVVEHFSTTSEMKVDKLDRHDVTL
jgi:hypothetical protein